MSLCVFYYFLKDVLRCAVCADVMYSLADGLYVGEGTEHQAVDRPGLQPVAACQPLLLHLPRQQDRAGLHGERALDCHGRADGRKLRGAGRHEGAQLRRRRRSQDACERETACTSVWRQAGQALETGIRETITCVCIPVMQ